MNTGIFFGSTTGNTEMVSEMIGKYFDNVSIEYIEVLDQNYIDKLDLIIFGIPTWNIGELESSWEDFFPNLDNLDFSNTVVAIFGLGDQFSYEDTFQDAMGILFEKLKEKNVKMIGTWSTTGYSFAESLAVRNGKFVGLALDEETQREKTESRIEKWVTQVKKEYEDILKTNLVL